MASYMAETPKPQQTPVTPLGARKSWRVGTLTYSAAGLVVLFCWLLWGDFAWNMKERAVQPMAQMLFKQFKASDLILGLMVTSLPAALGMLLGPIISVKSDNHRGRLGRRLPYLLIPTPIAAAAMIGMGYTPQLAEILASLLGAHAPDILTCRLIVFGSLWAFFEIFTVIANSVFYGLINDVVPQPVIGRFFALFRIVSLGAGILFNTYLIGHAEENYKIIFLALGALYGLGFTMMCIFVKEGDYPPPAPKQEGVFVSRVLEPVKAYFKECAAHPFYLWIFIASMLGNAAFLPINSFDVPYIKSIGMSLDRFGELRSITYGISIGLAFIIGWMADKFHPIRLGIFALGVYALVALWAGLVATDVTSFSIAYVVHGVVSGIFFTGTASLFPRLFPRAKFAQFYSAAGIILAVGFIGIPPVVGRILDLTNHAYHYTFVIGGAVAAVGCGVFLYLYSQFKRLGGMKNYQPPS
jgi:maltose/moltooligosaccharide transporter